MPPLLPCQAAAPVHLPAAHRLHPRLQRLGCLKLTLTSDLALQSILPSRKHVETCPWVQVWIALLATILGVVILMHVLARLTPLGNYDLKAVRLASASSSPPQEYIIDPGLLLVSFAWSLLATIRLGCSSGLHPISWLCKEADGQDACVTGDKSVRVALLLRLACSYRHTIYTALAKLPWQLLSEGIEQALQQPHSASQRRKSLLHRHN